MTFDQIIQQLENKKYHPIFFLMGEETYFIDAITDYIHHNVLNESERTFNLTILYGKDTDVATVINSSKRFPMMSEHQVVIVKEAQNLKNIDDLIYYVENPQKSTILVVNYKYGKLPKNKKLYKSLAKNALVFESAKLYEDKVPSWISYYLSKKGVNIKPEAALLLVDFLGNDLGKIAGELTKLLITLPKGEKTITSELIEKNIGVSKDYNNFELQKALAEKNALKAHKIIDYFNSNIKNNPINVTLSSLYFYFNKLFLYHFITDKSKNNVASVLKVHPFFVGEYAGAAKRYNPRKLAQVISLLREYDTKSKGINNVSTPPGELLRELVFKILH